MKKSTKVAIGLSVAAAASITAGVVISEQVIEKVKQASNRCKVKHFINDKFSGNEKLLNVVDTMSDDEVETVLNIIDKLKHEKNRIIVRGESFKDTADDLKERLFGFIDGINE